MDWLLHFVIIWLSLSVLGLVTTWSAVSIIQPRCPNWWRKFIVDDAPVSTERW